jgi:hypothetical protein
MNDGTSVPVLKTTCILQPVIMKAELPDSGF